MSEANKKNNPTPSGENGGEGESFWRFDVHPIVFPIAALIILGTVGVTIAFH